MKDGSKDEIAKQLREFNERCRTLPKYAVYRTEEWLKKNATYRNKDE